MTLPLEAIQVRGLFIDVREPPEVEAKRYGQTEVFRARISEGDTHFVSLAKTHRNSLDPAGSYWTGWPRVVADPRLPQTRTCSH